MDILALEGRTFGPHPLRVCQEKVFEFLNATGGDRRRWISAAPPGYMAAALFVVAPELLAQLTAFSVIHGEQTFTWNAPILIEHDLTVFGRVARIRERGGAYFVSFEMTVTDDGVEIAGGTSLFLVTPTTTGGSSESALPVLDVDELGAPEPGQRSASRADLVRYAAATRDWNPIHWDHGAALAAGLDGVVVHGLLQAAWALDAAAQGVDGDRPFSSAKIRFRNPLFPASPVTMKVEAEAKAASVEVIDEDSQFLTAQLELAEA